jgi:hypothetical protein
LILINDEIFIGYADLFYPNATMYRSYTYLPMYSSHYNCATGGFLHGINVIRELGEEEVNKDKIYVNFMCQFNQSI